MGLWPWLAGRKAGERSTSGEHRGHPAGDPNITALRARGLTSEACSLPVLGSSGGGDWACPCCPQSQPLQPLPVPRPRSVLLRDSLLLLETSSLAPSQRGQVLAASVAVRVLGWARSVSGQRPASRAGAPVPALAVSCLRPHPGPFSPVAPPRCSWARRTHTGGQGCSLNTTRSMGNPKSPAGRGLKGGHGGFTELTGPW